ncbi:MAG: integrin alpha [Planctomycetota bacterium]
MTGALLVALLLTSAPQASATAAPERARVFGHFRHVHWLAPEDDSFRFASAALVAPATMAEHLITTKAARSVVEVRRFAMQRRPGAPESTLEQAIEVPFRLFTAMTWTERPSWRVLELRGGTLLVCVDVAAQRLHLLDARNGEDIVAPRAATLLLDTRLTERGAELLIATPSQGLERVSIEPLDPASGTPTVDSVALATGLDVIGAASFVHAKGADAAPEGHWPGGCWVIGWRAGALALAGSNTDELLGPFPLTLEVTPKVAEELRFDVAAAGGRTWFAVGQPDYNHSVGRAVIASFEPSSNAAPSVTFDGRLEPDVWGDTLDQRCWGQSVQFVPDVDADGAPDLAVGAPWGLGDECIDLVSAARGTRLKRFNTTNFTTVGHSLDVSPDGRWVLSGGTTQRAYPENLTYEGVVHVLDARTLKGQRTSCIATRVESR